MVEVDADVPMVEVDADVALVGPEGTMSVHAPARPTWRAALTNRTFAANYLRMLAAMGIGMVVLGPLSMNVVHHARAEVEMLLMATTMVAGMAAWMVYRRHPWPAIVEMSAAMYASVAALFPFYWLGAVTPAALLILGHVLMLPGTAVAMLHRREHHLAAR
jgi:flagellar biosynthetic protein FliP